jgi:hypothetical protein
VADQTERLAWVVLRAANRTQAKGSTVRLVFPREPEVIDELGLGPTDVGLLSAVEYLQDRGYLARADIVLSMGAAYTLTPAGLAWLEEGPSDPSSRLPRFGLNLSLKVP